MDISYPEYGSSLMFIHRVVTESQIMKQELSRSQKVDLVSFYSLSHFYFLFNLFSICRTLRLGLEVICHTVTSVTPDGMVTTLITGLKRRT